MNNDYTHWEMYAIGGSAEPTINSQGNRYLAPTNPFAKEVHIYVCVCVCACVRAGARARARVCVCVCLVLIIFFLASEATILSVADFQFD